MWRKTSEYIKKQKGRAQKQPQHHVDKGALASTVEKEVAKLISVAAVDTPRPPYTQPFVTDE